MNQTKQLLQAWSDEWMNEWTNLGNKLKQSFLEKYLQIGQKRQRSFNYIELKMTEK